MKKALHLLLLCLTAFVSGQNGLPDDETLILQARLRPFFLSSALDSFSRRTYDLLSRGSPDKSMVFSPFSIHAATSMLFYGSQENSSTFQQLSDLLGLQRREHYGDYLLNYLLVLFGYEREDYVKSVNRLYVDDSVQLEPNFQGALARFYRASALKGDFANDGPGTADRINAFVSNVTQGNIKDIIGPQDIDELTRLVIINAIHFKGTWFNEFDPAKTRPGLFTLASKEEVIHPKMMNIAGHYWISDADPELGVDIIDLPYENEDYSMLLFIPNDPTDYSLTPLEDKLYAHEGSLFDNLYRRMISRKVNLTLPAFEVESSSDISETFIALGVTDVFDQSKSNLFDISSNYKDLHVDYIKHKAKILVNEEGTEASAATAIIVGTRSSSSIVHLRANRPFIFIIVDKKYNIALFMGKYMGPSQGGELKEPIEETPLPKKKQTEEDILFPFRTRDTLVLKKEHIIVNDKE